MLTVLALSESFSNTWPALAAECGLSLARADGPAAFDRLSRSVGVIAAGGAEDLLERTFRTIAPAGADVAAVGALPDHRVAVGVVRAGASEYFALPTDFDALRSWLHDRADRLHARSARSEFAAREEAKYRFDGIRGSSVALRAALGQAARVIPHGGVTVLITGETGTGKELLARAIHYNGPRREAPFVDVNCAALPEPLLESELFGHERGAFTDAVTAKPGLFEVASGGTLFLDEIGHLPPLLQGKLLRVLEERVLRRVGGTRNLPVDVRVIAATHVDLAAAVHAGAFREDLYYRLHVVPIALPPLRARRDDILPLARHFLAEFIAEYRTPVAFSPGAERALRSREWAGNVRELKNAVERAVLLARGPVLEMEDFEVEGRPRWPTDHLPFPAPLGDIVRAAAVEMLQLCGGNKSEAARRLDISRTRLLRLLSACCDDEATVLDAAR